jgi:hypothetical protein
MSLYIYCNIISTFLPRHTKPVFSSTQGFIPTRHL